MLRPKVTRSDADGPMTTMLRSVDGGGRKNRILQNKFFRNLFTWFCKRQYIV